MATRAASLHGMPACVALLRVIRRVAVVQAQSRVRARTVATQARVRPAFTTLRYGQPGYCQLGSYCPREIRAGAEDESEMGAFHDVFAPQRESNLKIRLQEYLRFGLEAGIFYAT